MTDFEVPLGQSFNDVYAIRLLDLQFTSSVNIVSSANNTISWINQEDIDIGYPVYTATLRNGTYNSSTISLVNEMRSKMNGIKRRNGNGTLHYFIITIDTDTDVVSFTSLNNRALPPSAFATTVNSNVVTVTLENHPYQQLDTIFFSNVLSLPGINSDYLNNQSFAIQDVPTSDTFTIEVNAVASATASGGGSSASVGAPADFKLLWGSSTNTCADILGFNDEDSNIINPVYNPLKTTALPIENATITSNGFLYVYSSNHGLIEGDVVKIVNLNTQPKTYGADGLGTTTLITNVDTPDTFICDLQMTSIDLTSLPIAFVGTSIITCNYISHGFNQINQITGAGTTVAQLTTVLSNQLQEGDIVYIGGTNTVPSILGRYVVTGSSSAYTFTVNLPTPLITNGTRGVIGDTGQNIIKSAIPAPGNSNVITVTTQQVAGIVTGQSIYVSLPESQPVPISGVYTVLSTLSSNTFQFETETRLSFTGSAGSGSVITFAETFILYNVSTTLGFPSSCINGVRFSVRDILSTSFFTFNVLGNYAGSAGPDGTGVKFGGDGVKMSANKQGFAGTQSNVNPNNAIIRNVNLSGPDFLYLTCPDLNMDDIVDASGKVRNILAKIYLNASPGTILFNQCTDVPKYFTNGLISIDRLHLRLQDSSGSIISTNNMDYSLSLQIHPITYEDIGNSVNTRNYMRIIDADEAMKEAKASGRVE